MFRRGAIDSLPVWLAIVPFGMIFGVVATAAGLDLIQVMGMTVVVAAGASQLAVLQLMVDDAPALLAIVTGAIVNLRMAMYSASLAVNWPSATLTQRLVAGYFLHDQSFAFSMRREREKPDEPGAFKLAYFLGVGVSTLSVWFIATYVGAVFGAGIPASWGMEFAIPVTFIAVTAPLLGTPSHAACAAVASLLAVLGAGLPGGLGLVLATCGGIATGLVVERVARP
jgi:predicted branched-subunit amino acid permease